MNNNKFKHLTLSDRIEIQECLEKSMTFKAISRRIGKDPTTVSKEIKLHLMTHTNSYTTTSNTCPKLLRAPFVCNGCPNRRSRTCHFGRRIYSAKHAQKEYESTLVESREGIALNKTQFYEDDRIITERIKAGQHLNHILASQNISCSKSSAYRYLHKGYLSVAAIDMPRVVKFKPRKGTPSPYVPKGVKVGRTYDDFTLYMEEHLLSSYCETDTVIGREGGKVIMTFMFVPQPFMFGLLLDNKTAAEASSKVIRLKERLAKKSYSFGDIFPVLLTDNGGEFSDVASFENALDGSAQSKLFFCDPMHSCQKPHVEKNHTLFRDIIPKGASFDRFTQDTVNLIFSHVNSVKRKSLNNKSPYEVMAFLYPAELLEIFGIKKICASEVIQSPKLQTTKAFLTTLK